MLIDKLKADVSDLDFNVKFGMKFLFVSNSRVSKRTVEGLDSIIDSEAVPVKQVSLISSKPINSDLESLFEVKKSNFSQFYWHFDNGLRDYSVLRDFFDYDVIVLTSGVVSLKDYKTNFKESFSKNSEIISRIAEQLRGYKGLVVVTTNPVDFIAEKLLYESGLNSNQVLGVYPESIRFRRLLADCFGISDFSLNKIRVCVSSIHGRAMFFYSSLALFDGQDVKTGFDFSELSEIFEKVKSWPAETMKNKFNTSLSTSSAVLEYLYSVLHPKTYVNASFFLDDYLLSKLVGRKNIVNHFNGWLAQSSVSLNKNYNPNSNILEPLFFVRFNPFPLSKVSIYNELSKRDVSFFKKAFEESSNLYADLNS